MRIGLDLDNTLVSYDQAFLAVGKAEGLLPPDFADSKTLVKASLLARRSQGRLPGVSAGHKALRPPTKRARRRPLPRSSARFGVLWVAEPSCPSTADRRHPIA